MTHLLPLLLLLGAAPADTATEPPSVAEPLPFDHEAHDRTFEKLDLDCGDCHPLGLVTDPEDPQDFVLPAPLSSCHGCHRGELPEAPRKAPGRCETCHDVRAELIPPTHDLVWMYEHGPSATERQADCRDCHQPDRCTTCHDVRGALARSPHLPGFSAVHGIEARLDPVSCVSCHAGDTCTSCHTTGRAPW